MKSAKVVQRRAKLEGLIEGPVPPVAGGEDRLHEWVTFAKGLGLSFHLSIDGAAFSLLPDERAIELGTDDGFPERLRAAVEQLLNAFPPELHARVFSTLRCVEEFGDHDRQSVIAISPRGVEVRSRDVDADAPKGRTEISIPRAYVLAGGVLLLLFLGSLPFIDLQQMWAQFKSEKLPLDVSEVTVDAGPLSRYVESKQNGLSSGRLVVEIARTPEFPIDLATLEAERERARGTGSLSEWIALQKLVVDGSIRVVYLDKEGQSIRAERLDVRGLLSKESITLHVPFRGVPSVQSLKLDF
ncbi:MAG: hypothetical protein AAF517_12320 [Planctomycetota bacterium]